MIDESSAGGRSISVRGRIGGEGVQNDKYQKIRNHCQPGGLQPKTSKAGINLIDNIDVGYSLKLIG